MGRSNSSFYTNLKLLFSQQTASMTRINTILLEDDLDELPQTTVEHKIAAPVVSMGKEDVVRTLKLDEDTYAQGFYTDVGEVDEVPPGLNEDIIRQISEKKQEPKWMLDFRLNSFQKWKEMEEPHWAFFDYPTVDYQSLIYYSAPKSLSSNKPQTVDDIDIEIRKTMTKLGISLEEQNVLQSVGMDVVWDSLSVFTTQREELAKLGIIFCSISEAIREHPDLIQKYLASVVPVGDNFFTALNSAVFSDGSFCYIPPGVQCPIDLSTYFRINSAGTGQFERTLVIADKGASVSYLEGCTAPRRSDNQLHAAVVELVAMENATIRYSTVQNWYPGDKEGKGGIFNFVTKRGDCRGDHSHISWTQVETGSAITWKYPSCILTGNGSSGEFHSVAVTNNMQNADTGTRMIHLGKNTTSTIVSKGISAGKSVNVYRGHVSVAPNADNALCRSKCDSLLIGSLCGAHTFPKIDNANSTSNCEHEASTSRISEDQLFFCAQRGIEADDAVNMIVNGFAKDVLSLLPLEFAAESKRLLGIVLEGSVG
ncbi:Fe-S cluster assembly protein SufB [Blattamonas nauphoetae]|uniref:Fe-S cluster assembly protein SufB n=1 Tax=Blattamonas nauphoetae TaxID=2049346 RepID=A0ABQ9X963_9EUKA|nr:Fe-S cluster assembly protein SufB [Blattamonas nauphoetae]